jgi:hypothetical protein
MAETSHSHHEHRLDAQGQLEKGRNVWIAHDSFKELRKAAERIDAAAANKLFGF